MYSAAFLQLPSDMGDREARLLGDQRQRIWRSMLIRCRSARRAPSLDTKGAPCQESGELIS